MIVVPPNTSRIQFWFELRTRGLDGYPVVELRDDAENDTEEQSRRDLVCRFCMNSITSDSFRISVLERHEHTFYNPEGVIYRIGCFSTATGCVDYGDPTYNFTWFEGYAWRFSSCSVCHEHLGWMFMNSNSLSFYGLILNKLVEARKQ